MEEFLQSKVVAGRSLVRFWSSRLIFAVLCIQEVFLPKQSLNPFNICTMKACIWEDSNKKGSWRRCWYRSERLVGRHRSCSCHCQFFWAVSVVVRKQTCLPLFLLLLQQLLKQLLFFQMHYEVQLSIWKVKESVAVVIDDSTCARTMQLGNLSEIAKYQGVPTYCSYWEDNRICSW